MKRVLVVLWVYYCQMMCMIVHLTGSLFALYKITLPLDLGGKKSPSE